MTLAAFQQIVYLWNNGMEDREITGFVNRVDNVSDPPTYSGVAFTDEGETVTFGDVPESTYPPSSEGEISSLP